MLRLWSSETKDNDRNGSKPDIPQAWWIAFTTWYDSNPSLPPSEPKPESLTPPNGASARLIANVLIPTMIITDLAVFQRPDHDSPFKLIELAPGVSTEEVRQKTTAKYVE